MYRGDIRLGDTIDLKFTTRSFTTGAPTTLAGTPVISAYVGNSVTQITAGITLSVDFDAVTGLHNIRVVATSGNGYATASNYDLVITTGTVGGVSVVGEVVGSFSIEARSAVMPTTAARTLDISAGGEAGLDWANIGSPTTAQNLSATNIDVDQVVASVSGAVGSVAAGGITAASIATGAIDADSLAADAGTEIAAAVWDLDATAHQTQGTFGQAIGDPVADTGTIFKATVTDATGVTVGTDTATLLSRLGTPSDLGTGATVAANLVDIEGQTDDIGVAGAGLTAINLPDQTMNITGNITGNLSGSVGSVTGNVGGSVASVTAGVTLAASAVQAIWDALTSALTTVGSIGKLLVDNINATISSRLATAGYTTPPTAAANADAVWEEALADHSGTVGSTAEALAAAGSAGDPWATQLPGAYGAGSAGKIVGDNINAPVATVDTVVDAIKAKTDSLTFTVAGQVDANIQYVNDVVVTGTGAVGDEWGP